MSSLQPMPEVDAQLLTELYKRWEKDGALFGDVYSACCRPGSWEFALPFAATLRELLKQNGYTATTDPDASWRLIWRRVS